MVMLVYSRVLWLSVIMELWRLPSLSWRISSRLANQNWWFSIAIFDLICEPFAHVHVSMSIYMSINIYVPYT